MKRGPIPQAPAPPPVRLVELTIDGAPVSVPAGSTILDACESRGIETPTLCFLESLTPVNACRVCVVELEGSRVLVPACARRVESGMTIRTDSERVRHSRKMVLEFLASSVELSTAPDAQRYCERYGADPHRFGEGSATVAQPAKIDNALYVRDYSKCILCYKCVEACGTDAQNTFAIAVAGRGFDAHISTEFDVPLPDSACVYCGNCIGVCPTGALMFSSEHELRERGEWKEAEQSVTDTICSYCGVGCTLSLHVQDNAIVKVLSPIENGTTSGHLCIKGRFGYQYVQNRPTEDGRD
ncbi:MAG TPA: 2Fe-2S iron-sulfur cluster-binding protein [Candidatus Cybelea sp.]|jgi:predicted molibdopterin-dependent oxidoreductase YjgC|nr:2Fe-2S iron-sulfur cluster-binding protein [Candidatus Cybelea sp.]